MDKFYHKLAMQISMTHHREKKNEEFLSRILDAKQSIKEGDPIDEEDIALIDNLLDDTLKLSSIINDHFDSFEKFLKMYSKNE